MIKKFLVLIFIVLLISCSKHGNIVNPLPEYGKVHLLIEVGKVGSLAKRTANKSIGLERLEIQLFSDEDTIYKTIPLTENTEEKIVSVLVENLVPDIIWTARGQTYDVNGIQIHSDNGGISFGISVDTITSIPLVLTAKYSMLVAKFYPMDITYDTCKILLDGIVVGIKPVTQEDLSYDYCKVHFDYFPVGKPIEIELQVIGTKWGTSYTFYKGGINIVAAAGVDISKTIELIWVGPDQSDATLKVTLGRIGTVNIDGKIVSDNE